MTLSHNDLPPDDRTMKKIIKKKKRSVDPNQIQVNEINLKGEVTRVSDSDSEMEDVSDDYLKSSSELSEELSDMYSDSNDEYEPNTTTTTTTSTSTTATKRPTKKLRSPDNSPPSSALPSLQHSPQETVYTKPVTMNTEIVYTGYQRSSIRGWEQYATPTCVYSPTLVWTDPLVERSKPGKLMDAPTSYEMSIRQLDDRIALFADTDIPDATCIGEYTGEGIPLYCYYE
jgi:hypothetical protein